MDEVKTPKSWMETLSRKLPKCLLSKRTVILIFALYFCFGMLIYKDYGISYDEELERHTSLINYVHIMRPHMLASENESVRAVAEKTPELATYEDRFYGAALQCVTVIIEHIFNFELAHREIYLMRHAFVFLNFFLAGICFYLIIRSRFGNGVLPLLGVLAFILYPRFFGEAFYNIKDILFFSWMVISGYFVLRWLKDRAMKYCFPAAAALAVAINTRILGLSLLLLACGFAVIISVRKKETFLRAAGRPLALVTLTLSIWVLITPFLWGNPLKNMAATFYFFLNVVEWSGVHLYMGEMITRHVPWHYIPIWMGITIPIPYIVMFFVGVASICVKVLGRIKRTIAMYDLFMAALFFCTLLGYIVLGISMYEGWRHAYGIYFPFLYIAVCGLDAAINFVHNKRAVIRRIGGLAVAGTFFYLFAWICINHPYQYVYFNIAARPYAERNFTLDYWELSHIGLIRYVLGSDESAEILFDSNAGKYFEMFDEWEKSRIRFTDRANCNYILQNTRIPYEERIAPDGFEIYGKVEVDGMRISTVYKRVSRYEAELDPGAKDNIIGLNSNINDGSFEALIDNDKNTLWTPGWGRNTGDFLIVEFAEPVDYDVFSFAISREGAEDVLPAMVIYISKDQMSGRRAAFVKTDDVLFFELKPEPYKFIVFEAVDSDADNPWSIHELSFGRKVLIPN